jgi:hypothetical protein
MTDQFDHQSGDPKPQFDPVFPRLVKADGRGEKLFGFIADRLYQDAKREWISDFQVREKRYPSEEELRFYERSWTALRLEALENTAAQLVAAYTDSVVIQAEKQILRGALMGSYWRSVLRWAGGALLYTLLLFAIAIALSRSGINLIAMLDKIIGPR